MKKVVETYFIETGYAPVYKLDSGEFVYPVIDQDKICRWKTKEEILKHPFTSPESKSRFEEAIRIFEG